MWIRSQERKHLSNENTLYIRALGKGYAISSEKLDLGKYSTKEKAIKVMDMIQSQLIFCTEKYTKVSPVLVDDQWEPFWKKHESVFQMPQDSEVKA